MNKELYRKAVEMTNMSYAPFSKFRVGAALMAKDGRIFTGCNVENSSFGGTICAERTAFVKAVSEGVKEFERIAIASSGGEAWPCGICRQVLTELLTLDTPILMATREKQETVLVKDLMPAIFGPEDLE